jgi:hypothetical protein
MNINLGNIERLEVKCRKKCMLSLPDCTTSAVVYLCIGVLPAAAQRDIEILGLFGQLALCDPETQNIRNIIEHTLTFYGGNFPGWSGVVRKTCSKYSLPDPCNISSTLGGLIVGDNTVRNLSQTSGKKNSSKQLLKLLF